MQICGLRESTQVARVRGENVVAIAGEAYHRRIDGIGLSSLPQQYPGPSPQTAVDGGNLDPCQQPGERHLTAMAPAPYLSHYATTGDWGLSGSPFAFDQRDHTSVALLDGEKGPRIEHQHQAAPRLGCALFERRLAGLPRITVARSRASREACRISSSLISPCSAS